MSQQHSAQEFASRIKANSDPKLNAAADFAARLLDSPIGPSVARIILFGSVASNQAGPQSDVDVMVFSAAPLENRSEHAAQAAWEASVAWGEQVAQVTFCLGDLLQPRSYLLYDTINRGKEIFSMEEAEIRRMEAEGLFRKAHRHLESAQRAASQGDFELAILGAYTASELAAKALILLKPGVDLPATHGGMIQVFSREYVKSGEAPERWGRTLNQGLEARSHALYDTLVTMVERDAEPVINLAQEMIDFLEKKLYSR